jgi:hypothetical protein
MFNPVRTYVNHSHYGRIVNFVPSQTMPNNPVLTSKTA